MEAWKTVLEETEKAAKVRQQTADVYLTQIGEPIKNIRTHKGHVAKKVSTCKLFDQLLTGMVPAPTL